MITSIKELILGKIIFFQAQINETIGGYFDMLEDGNKEVYFYILAISFLYGLIHALGPGHGKVVIAGYFLAKGKKIADAFKAGFLTAVIHTFSALLVVGVLYIIFQGMFTSYFANINQNMYKVSAIFILALALYMFYELLFHHEQARCSATNKGILAISLSIGIVPCPGVMSIVLYAMLVGYIGLGFFSAILMSVGMGITISLAGILATKVKFSNSQKLFNIVGYIGAFILLFFSVALLV